MWRARQQLGFTIVELLIVVVVIAILAAITIVSYNGITKQANSAVLQNEVKQSLTLADLFYIDNGEYPEDLDEIDIASTDTKTYQYSVNNASNPAGYCVTVTSGELSFYVARKFTYDNGTQTLDQPTPTEGKCPVHVEGWVEPVIPVTVRNLALNPSAETSLVGYDGPNGSGHALSTTRAMFGTRSILVTLPNGYTNGNIGLLAYRANSIAGYLEPNTQYTASVYAYVPSGTVDMQMNVQGSARASVDDINNRIVNLKNQWQRVWYVFTTGASGSITVYLLNNATTTTAGTQLWVDGIMINEGNTPIVYGDGDSPGWSWDGTPGDSTSRGPLLSE